MRLRRGSVASRLRTRGRYKAARRQPGPSMERRPDKPRRGTVCKEKLDEQGQKGLREPLLCMEPLLQNGNPGNEVGTRSGVLRIFHSMILEEESGKILEKERVSHAEKNEESSGPCYIDQQSGSLTPEKSLGCHQLAFATIQLPAYFGDENPVPPISESELNHELADQPVLQSPAEVYSLSITEKEAKKNRTSQTLEATSLKASSAALGETLIPEQVQTANQNLGSSTCQSARCTAVLSTCPQPGISPLCQVSQDSQDGAKEKESPPEPPKDPLPPARKKTRTFYSPEQLEELERMFLEDHYPDSEKRREIAAAVGVTPQRVMVWFQNRRAKWRKIEKLTIKGTKKCSAPAPSTCQAASPLHSTQGAPLHPKPALSDVVLDQPTALEVPHAAMVNSSGLLPGQPALLASASVWWLDNAGILQKKHIRKDMWLPHNQIGIDLPALPEEHPAQEHPDCYTSPLPHSPQNTLAVVSVSGRGTPYEAVPTKLVSQDIFPAISSPPPIRRASLPLSMAFNPNNHIVPLRLDTPGSECSPSSSQESSSSEVLTYSSQSQSSSSPLQCSYPEQLEPTANLETPYYYPTNQSGAFQYSQPQAPSLYHFPIHLTGSVLPGVHLTPATPSKSSSALFSLSGNGGLMAYPQEGSVLPYLQNHVGGQLLIQPSTGNSGYVPALQAVPWNEFYMQGAPFPNQPCSQVQFSNCGGGAYSAEQIQYAQKPCATSGACLLQLPRVTLPGSTLLFTTKQMVPSESSSNPDPHSLEEHMLSSERDSDTDNNPKEEGNVDDFSEESKD